MCPLCSALRVGPAKSRKPGARPGFFTYKCLSQLRQSGVQGLAGTHGFFSQREVRLVVTANVLALALGIVQLGNYLGFVLAQCLGQTTELGLQLQVIVLFGQGLRPVQSQIEVAAAVIDLTNLARGRLAVFQQLAGGLVQGSGQYQSLVVAVSTAQVFQGSGQGQELA